VTEQAKTDGGGPPAHLAAILKSLRDESKLDILLRKSPLDAKTLIDLIAYLSASDKRTRQQAAANSKHAPNRAARKFVLKLWHSKRHLYKFNIEFSKDAAAAVLKKYQVSVKAETICRDWLRGIGESASMAQKNGAIAYVDGRYIKGTIKKATNPML
jgi:Mg/Co/Ni transporter MgtE